MSYGINRESPAAARGAMNLPTPIAAPLAERLLQVTAGTRM